MIEYFHGGRALSMAISQESWLEPACSEVVAFGVQWLEGAIMEEGCLLHALLVWLSGSIFFITVW